MATIVIHEDEDPEKQVFLDMEGHPDDWRVCIGDQVEFEENQARIIGRELGRAANQLHKEVRKYEADRYPQS